MWGKNGCPLPPTHGGHLASSTLNRHFYAARQEAGRPDLRFHDLRTCLESGRRACVTDVTAVVNVIVCVRVPTGVVSV